MKFGSEKPRTYHFPSKSSVDEFEQNKAVEFPSREEENWKTQDMSNSDHYSSTSYVSDIFDGTHIF